MASGEESSRPQGVENKPRKRKKKRTRWKVNDKRIRPRYRRKRRKTDSGSVDRVNPQREPRQKTCEIKEEDNEGSVHMRGWTMTVVSNTRSRTKSADRIVGSEDLDKISDTVVSDGVMSVPSKNNEVRRTSVQEKNLNLLESNQDNRTAISGNGNNSKMDGQIGTVLQATIASPTSNALSGSPVGTSTSSAIPVSRTTLQQQDSIRTPRVKHVPIQPPAASTQNIPSHTPRNLDNRISANVDPNRTREREVSLQQTSSRSSSESRNVQEVPSRRDQKEEEDDDDVLIEEIKIEDDSSDGKALSFANLFFCLEKLLFVKNFLKIFTEIHTLQFLEC